MHPNRFLVQAGVYEAFADKLVARVNDMRVGSGFEPGVAIGPMINEAAISKINRHVADALSNGGRIATRPVAAPKGMQFTAPVVLTNETIDMVLAHEETFGPVAPLFRFETDEEAIAIANATPFGLAAYF
jgi:succinate-semialdehyde dehydrogenase / glutarate-semialdehyde dehydrogenase